MIYHSLLVHRHIANWQQSCLKIKALDIWQSHSNCWGGRALRRSIGLQLTCNNSLILIHCRIAWQHLTNRQERHRATFFRFVVRFMFTKQKMRRSNAKLTATLPGQESDDVASGSAANIPVVDPAHTLRRKDHKWARSRYCRHTRRPSECSGGRQCQGLFADPRRRGRTLTDLRRAQYSDRRTDRSLPPLWTLGQYGSYAVRQRKSAAAARRNDAMRDTTR